jgi:uncharacterized protein (TIGR03000 family)
MKRSWLMGGGILAAAAALLLLVPEKSAAQFMRRGWGVNMGGVGSYSGNPYAFGYGPAYGAGYSGWYPGTSYGWSPRTDYSSFSGAYPRTFYGGSYSPSSWGGYRGWSSPRYSSYTMGTSGGGFYASEPGAPSYYSEGEGMPPVSERAVLINLQVPPEAQVWFGDHKTEQGGMFRQFVSPPLEPGQPYTYDIRVQWNANGEPVTRERTLRVQAGDQMNLDFRRPQGGTASSDFPSERTRERTPPSPGGTQEPGTFDRDRSPGGTGDRGTYDRGTTPGGTGDRGTIDRGTTPSGTGTTPRGTSGTPGGTGGDRP